LFLPLRPLRTRGNEKEVLELKKKGKFFLQRAWIGDLE
jgi:hypothetical protein